MSKKTGKRGGNTDKTVLKGDVIAKYLWELGYSDDYQGMQYIRLEMSGTKLEALNNALLEVKHLKYLNFTDNKLADVTLLQQFDQLVYLGLNSNKIKNLNAFTSEEGFPKLRKLELSDNSISELIPITPPKLEYLEINDMKIDKYETWTGHPTIRILKAEDNKFKSLSVIKDMPMLEEAYLSGNQINSFSGYDNVGSLKKLILQRQKVDKIEEELPEMPALETLDLSENRINSLDDLKNIFQFATLTDLNILGTPLETNATSFNMLLAEIMILFHGLGRFWEVDVTEQHKYEGLYLAEYRWRKAEEERLRKEEEERLKAEAEGGD